MIEPSLRPASEIRAEIAKWKAVARVRRPKYEMESLAAAMIVQTLKWSLGETASPAIRDSMK